MTIASQLFRELDAAMDNSFSFLSDSLPETFRHKRETRTIASIKSQLEKANAKKVDPRAKRNSPERLQTIQAYATMVEREEEIQWCENTDLQYNAMLRFAEMMVEIKVWDESTFEEE